MKTAEYIQPSLFDMPEPDPATETYFVVGIDSTGGRILLGVADELAEAEKRADQLRDCIGWYGRVVVEKMAAD